jgi:hypothetical protein
MKTEMHQIAGITSLVHLPDPVDSGEHEDEDGHPRLVPDLSENVLSPINMRYINLAMNNVMQEVEVSQNSPFS